MTTLSKKINQYYKKRSWYVSSIPVCRTKTEINDQIYDYKKLEFRVYLEYILIDIL